MCAEVLLCIYDIRVCSTVGDAHGDKVWMARLWRQVSQLSLRSLTSSSSSMFSFGLKDDILTSVPFRFGQLDGLVCINITQAIRDQLNQWIS